jgi:hypothetical protein
MTSRIRLADWRDWRAVHALRRTLHRPLDGGLYELLNWPIYHAHLACVGETVVGFTAVVLWPDGVADDVGTVVASEARRQRVASDLRATQARDLLRMGWQRLYCAVPSDDTAAMACAHAHFGEALGELDSTTRYFGAPLATLAARLAERGVRPPYPLSPANDVKLLRKADAARVDLQHLARLADLNIQKAALRA